MPYVSVVRQKLEGLLLGSSVAQSDVGSLLEHSVRIPLTASTAAGITVAEHGYTPLPDSARAIKVHVVSDTTVSSNATNYARITVLKRSAAGTNAKSLAEYSTSNQDIKIRQGNAFEMETSNDFVVAGGCLSLKVEKEGTGVSTDDGTVVVSVRRQD